MKARTWDVYCRVVDNLGDIGVCWRLAADLAARGQAVRLHVDDAAALAFMAPHGAAGVEVHPWRDVPAEAVGDVVIEAFGCELPLAAVARMAERRPAPLWINLEYLSAEAYVERCHALASPQSAGPGAGLRKWFFFPGFSPATGGLLREPGLSARRAAFDAATWLRSQGIARASHERVMSLFCYDQPALAELLRAWRDRPTLLLATAGPAARQVAALDLPRDGPLRVHTLPWLSQADFDHLLWASDVNIVRGEDSFVRAIWAGKPFVWNIYPQADGAHEAKLEAFLEVFLGTPRPGAAQADPRRALGDRSTLRADRSTDVETADAGLATEPLRRLFRRWNGLAGAQADAPPPDLAAWSAHCARFRSALEAQPDLVTQLMGFEPDSR